MGDRQSRLDSREQGTQAGCIVTFGGPRHLGFVGPFPARYFKIVFDSHRNANMFLAGFIVSLFFHSESKKQ